jgi:hypothetical protein
MLVFFSIQIEGKKGGKEKSEINKSVDVGNLLDS